MPGRVIPKIKPKKVSHRLHYIWSHIWLILVFNKSCDSVVRLRAAVGHLHGRCRPASCWSAWVYQRRRSASSTGRLWPESPGDSGLCPAWRGQLYRQPATTSCGRRTCVTRHRNTSFLLWTLFRESDIYLCACENFIGILMAQRTTHFIPFVIKMCLGVVKWKITCNVCRLQAGSPSRACSLPWDPSQIFSLGKLETFSW